MKALPRSLLTAAIAAAIATSIVAAPVLLSSSEDAAPGPTPTPGIRVKAGEIRAVPTDSKAILDQAKAEIGETLLELYTTAFVAPEDVPASPSPAPGPSERISASFTKDARAALASNPGVFDETDGLSVFSGDISYSGLVSYADSEPFEAFLDVEFLGDATPDGASAPVARVHQKGTLQLRRSAGEWFVSSFALRLSTRPATTPSPKATP